MANIRTSIESARGCGYRKTGGIYMVGSGSFAPCEHFPIELTVCPCCSTGIKQTRGWTWVKHELLGVPKGTCGLNDERYGLIWVGECFYPTPGKFLSEAQMAGISRKLGSIPKGFELGKTKILLAHAKAVVKHGEGMFEFSYAPGIFASFTPERIEYVVNSTETPSELADLEKRGLSLVKVIRDVDAQRGISDQLQTWQVKWLDNSGHPNFTTSIGYEAVQAADKQGARNAFKKAFPGRKIISVK